MKQNKEENINPMEVQDEIQLQFNNLFEIPLNDPLLGLLKNFVTSSIQLSSKVQLEDIQLNIEDWENKVGEYGKQGLWRGLAAYMKQQIATTDNQNVELLFKLWCYRLISLIKLNLCQLAQAELDKLGDLFAPKYRLESQNNGDKKGSIIPFILFVIWARLPAYLGDTLASVDRIYYLIHCCRKEMIINPESTSLYKHRIIQLALLLLNYLLQMDELVLGTQLLNNLAEQVDTDGSIWNCLLLWNLYGGNIVAAEHAFDQFKKYEGIRKDQEYILNFTLNECLILMAKGQWQQVNDKLEAKSKQEELNFKLINILAISNLYLGQLPRSIELLKGICQNFAKEGQPLIPKVIILNLTTLFELTTLNHLEKKKDLLHLLNPFLGDGYDIDSFKLN